MITERCPWIDLFITTWAGVTYWRGQITRSRYSCGLYRRSALLTKLFAGHIITTRSTGYHTSRLSLYIKKLYALLSIPKQQFSIDFQSSRVLKTLYRHLEMIHVIPRCAMDLSDLRARSFAALRMTCRTPLEAAHGKSSLQMSRHCIQKGIAHRATRARKAILCITQKVM